MIYGLKSSVTMMLYSDLSSHILKIYLSKMCCIGFYVTSMNQS